MTQTQQAITEALRAVRVFVFMTQVRDFSGLTEDELLESQRNVAEEAKEYLARIDAALVALESASPVEPAPQYPCPHARPSWKMCPHCLGLNRPGKAPTGYPMAWGDGTGEVEAKPAEDAPACDCPARKAISELLKCPDGRSLTWPEIDEICRAALDTPCPTAELRDEIEQHNLWRAEAYRQIAEKDADIAQLRKNYAQSMKSANRDIEGLMASLAALKRETAAKCAEICDSAAKSCLEWTKCDRSGCTCSACSEQRSMAGACRETAREIRAAFGLDETTGEAVSR